MKKDFLFILLGSDENAYGIARSYYELFKTNAYSLCSRRLPTSYNSKILDIKIIKNFDIEKVCIENLLKIGTNLKERYKKLILVPCSDHYMEICIKNKNILSSIYENKFIDYTLLEKFVTKDKFYTLCEKYNLKYPKTIICTYEERNNIEKKINFNYPIVLKPNNSNSQDYLSASFKGKKKVYIVSSEEELKEIIKNINTSTYKDNLIIQEYISGDDTCDYVINAYSNSHGKVVFMGLGHVLLEEYHPKTYGNYAVIVSHIGYHSLFNKIKNFLESIEYKGFSNFDFKYDAKRKEFYIFEINYRQGRSSFFIEAAGTSMVGLIYNDLVLDKTNEKVTYLSKKILWLNVPSCIAKKYITNSESLKEVKYLLKNKQATHTLIYKKDMCLKRLIHIVKIYLSKILQFKDYFIKK